LTGFFFWVLALFFLAVKLCSQRQDTLVVCCRYFFTAAYMVQGHGHKQRQEDGLRVFYVCVRLIRIYLAARHCGGQLVFHLGHRPTPSPAFRRPVRRPVRCFFSLVTCGCCKGKFIRQRSVTHTYTHMTHTHTQVSLQLSERQGKRGNCCGLKVVCCLTTLFQDEAGSVL
jgi:hypothetical protein